MTSRILYEVDKTAQKQVRNKLRKSLQTLQLCADEQILIGNCAVHPNEKTLSSKKKLSKAVEKEVAAEKENAPTLRRSKRKLTIFHAKHNIEPKTQSRAKSVVSLKTKSKTTCKYKERCSVTAVSREKTCTKESKLKYSPSVVSVLKKSPNSIETAYSDQNVLISSHSSEVTEDSGFESSARVSDQSPIQSIAVFNSPDIKCSSSTPYDVSILTCDNPPTNYWKDLAEQRRAALEKALHENELMYDQLAVLETQNCQLKQLVNEAEEFAQLVKDAIK